MIISKELEAKILSQATTVNGKPVRTQPLSDELTEKEFQAEVVKLAKKNGWKCYHTHNSRRSDSGFPDLVLVRESVIFAELKTAAGKFSAAQLNWLDALDEAGADVYRWRPADWPAIAALLSTPRPSPQAGGTNV